MHYVIELAVIGILVLQGWLFYKERKQLLDRIMSKTYQEYEYYQKVLDGELKELKKEREKAREFIPDEIFEPSSGEKPVDLSMFEEDWTDEQIDEGKLKSRLKK